MEPSNDQASEGKGRGCVMGGLALIGASVASGLTTAAFLAVLPDAMELANIVGLAVFAGLLVWAILSWKSMPGFVLGIGLTFGIIVVVFTACTALILSNLGVVSWLR